MKKIIATLLTIYSINSMAQNVGVNTTTPDASAVLDVTSTNKGMLIPRVALTATNVAAPVTAPVVSLLVYNTNTAGAIPNDVKPGYYYWDGAKWVGIGGDSWRLTGNAGTSSATNFLGTIDAQDVVLKTNSIEALRILNTNGNVGIGTINPQRKLHLHSTFNNFHAIQLTAENQTDFWDIVRRGQTYATPDCFVISHNGNTDFNISPNGSVGISKVADASAKLDVISTTSGFAMPRMTSVQRKAIVAPLAGLQVFDVDLKGFYYYTGTKWDCVSVPAGSVNYFANSTSPDGYLECNGQDVNRTTYAELFAAIGTLYGVGNGATTFNVPDLRGEFVRGVDNTRGVDPARAIGTWQVATAFMGDGDGLNLPIPILNNATHQAVLGFDIDALPSNATSLTLSYEPAPIGSCATTGMHSIGGASVCTDFGRTRPRNVAMLPCIKY